MKFDPSDAANAPGDEAGGADLEALRDIVKVTRSRGPSQDAARRITERLVAAGALEPASLSETARTGANAPMRIAERVGFYKLGAVALAVVAAGSLLVWRATWTSDAPAVVMSSGATTPEVVSTNAPPTGAGETTGLDRAPAANEAKGSATDVAAVPIDALPSAAPKMRAPAASGSTADSNTKAAESAGASTAAAELVLIRRAQDALSSDPARALAIANEHAQAFPRGELTQEREVVAVEALSKLGRKDDALRRANALLRRFPRTPYVAHLEKALGEPLSVPVQRGDTVNPSSKPTP